MCIPSSAFRLPTDFLRRSSLHPLHPHGDQRWRSADRHHHSLHPQLHFLQAQRLFLLLLHPGGGLHHQEHPGELSQHGHRALRGHLRAPAVLPDLHREEDLHGDRVDLVHLCGA